VSCETKLLTHGHPSQGIAAPPPQVLLAMTSTSGSSISSVRRNEPGVWRPQQLLRAYFYSVQHFGIINYLYIVHSV
jgi:hypothetical protein